ncbi:MAG: molybdopterin-guanine dinucleotide biosynthesis protein B [Betaproteobacteria bacterium]|nr:molybdopterin-guanine dinucleotide biosynthesis protein B [Betaproteobacteria bacterium]MDE2131760.1 molybdopterin-guanine dinucleotide biosynthesis protein B [Betaproteobacteria bacterium]MDE2211387.1 molybdopterin-guanine dinucleotide biosynthesis protein B [Betaproteobacteria bacterium]MDE2354698.1 molybdopterin-guanine dinucleotide biosynthesis protein B [Betaproteobacteria bacterium]
MSAVLGFAGYSGAGKTTLIEQVIRYLVGWGIRVSLIKHAHHEFDIDVPGKDSWRHRKAGAHEVMVASGQRWALMHEHRGEPEPSLDALIARLSACDLVLVEGFKKDPIPKLEVWRASHGAERLSTDDPWLIGLVTDEPQGGLLPCLDINDPEAVAHFIVQRFDLMVSSKAPVGSVQLRYFARLRETLQTEAEAFPLAQPIPLAALIALLRQRGGAWDEALSDSRPLRAAVNQELVALDALVKPGDEVALFPPVTGG